MISFYLSQWSYCIEGRKEVDILPRSVPLSDKGNMPPFCQHFPPMEKHVYFQTWWFEIGKHLCCKWLSVIAADELLSEKNSRFSNLTTLNATFCTFFYEQKIHQGYTTVSCNTISALSTDVQWGISSVSHTGWPESNTGRPLCAALWSIALYLSAGQIPSYQEV